MKKTAYSFIDTKDLVDMVLVDDDSHDELTVELAQRLYVRDLMKLDEGEHGADA